MTQHEQVATRAVRPFAEMVESLFKKMDNDAGSLMHAAIGISGEAGELVVAVALNDVTNVVEELGDARFYMQAIMNMYGWTIDAYVPEEYIPSHALVPGIGDVSMFQYAVSFQVVAADILDVVKKQWVYNKPLDEAALFDHMGKLVSLYRGLMGAYALNDAIVQAANANKLGKRYPDGVYSDSAAQARADKATDPNLGALAA